MDVHHSERTPPEKKKKHKCVLELVDLFSPRASRGHHIRARACLFFYVAHTHLLRRLGHTSLQ